VARYRTISTDAVPAGEARVAYAGDRSLAICNVDGEIFAIDNRCTHDNGPLGEGKLDGDQIECPRHDARFDVRTGHATRLPAVRPVKTYPVRVEKGIVCVDLEDEW
jgi:3-phenylpropionate/trans-cinnamate dioxygenase ferredoxin component